MIADLLPSLPSLSSLYLQGNNLMLLDDVLQVVSNRFPSLSVLCLRNIDGSKANPCMYFIHQLIRDDY